MGLKDLRFLYFVVLLYSNLLTNESAAASIPAGGIVADGKAKEQLVSDKAQEIVGGIELKRNGSNNHGAELNFEKSPDKSLSNEPAMEEFSASRSLFIEQDVANRAQDPDLRAMDYFQSKMGMPASKYSYADEKLAFKNLLEQVRFGLGEGVYSKLIWTYYDLKDLDDRIYSSLAGYDLSGAGFLGKLPKFVGVNDQINALIILGYGAPVNGKAGGVESGNNKSSGSKVVLDFSSQNIPVNDDSQSEKARLFFKYFTIKNILYSLLSVLGFGMVWRIFRFFMKQDLS